MFIPLGPFFFGLEGSWGQPQWPNSPPNLETTLALCLYCSTAALTTPQKVFAIWRLVELKMLDFSDHTRTGISILTSAADTYTLFLPIKSYKHVHLLFCVKTIGLEVDND